MVLNSCREKSLRGNRGQVAWMQGWNGQGKTNGTWAAPPHTSRFPAAQRLQERLGARLCLKSCSSSCILFLRTAPDNARLFIALGSFSMWLSKERPCLQVTKVSCRQSKQKAGVHNFFTDHCGHQVEPTNDLFTFETAIYQPTGRAVVLESRLGHESGLKTFLCGLGLALVGIWTCLGHWTP